MAAEKMKIATEIFAKLMKHKMVDLNESVLRSYFDDSQVHDLVQQIAHSFGTIILEGHEKLQLISDGKDSIFATSFTHLKEKYSDIENKKEFYLLCNILMIYLSEIDGDLSVRSRNELRGLSFYRLEELITKVYSFWKVKIENDEEYEKKWAMNIRVQVEYWLSKDIKDDSSKLTPSMKNKFSIIKKAMNLLENEHLVNIIQEGDEHMIFAYPELYERIEGLFHNYERYTMLRSLIVEANERKDEVNVSY
jgi:hypothetical protein